MKKLLITIILLTVCAVHAQTDEKETFKQLNKTVVSLYQNQKFDEALKSALQAADLSVKVFGAEHVETAIAYTNLGLIYREKRKFDESIETLQKAADIYLKVSGFKGEQSYRIYETLAYSQFLDGKKKEAEINYLKALETTENNFGKESKESFSPALSLANFYARDGKFQNADELYLKAYSIAIKFFGKKGKETEQIGDSRMCLYHGQKISDEREKAFDTARDKLFGVPEAAAVVAKGKIINGRALSLVKPPYPGEAKEKRLSGTVLVRVEINEQGNVIKAKSICRNDVLGKASEEAALASKFTPTIKDGKPVIVTGIIVYNFVAQ